MKTKTILVLGATFDTGNMGVGALTAGVLTALARTQENAKVMLLDYGRYWDVKDVEIDGKVLHVPLINLRFSKKILLRNNAAYLLLLAVLTRLLGRRTCRRLIEQNRWLKTISDADVAVAISGGDSFSDIYGLERFFYVCLPQLLVGLLGKRLILLPQTIGPFNGRLARTIARVIMKDAEIVYSRDLAGVREGRSLLRLDDEDPKMRFGYDMGFIVEPRRPTHQDWQEIERSCFGRPVVGLNVSGLLYIGGYNRRNMFQLKLDYRELIDRIIAHLIEAKGVDVLLVPHVFGTEEESDTAAIQAVYGTLKERHHGRLFAFQGVYDQHEIKYVIGRCEFFIGSRMHACIAALSQAVPAVGIAYSRKFAGVLESIGVGHLVADPRTLTIAETLVVIDSAYENRRTISSHLGKVMPEVGKKVLDVFCEVA